MADVVEVMHAEGKFHDTFFEGQMEKRSLLFDKDSLVKVYEAQQETAP